MTSRASQLTVHCATTVVFDDVSDEEPSLYGEEREADLTPHSGSFGRCERGHRICIWLVLPAADIKRMKLLRADMHDQIGMAWHCLE